MAARLRVTYRRSVIGHPGDQRETLRSLGLRRLNQSVTVEGTPVILGMIRKVNHLVRVEPVEDEVTETDRRVEHREAE